MREYQDFTVQDLRTMARSSSTVSASGVEISGANKGQLMAWLSNTEYTEQTPTITQHSGINGNAGELLANFQSAMAPLLNGLDSKLDESRVIELIKEYQPDSVSITVKQHDKPSVNVGVQHAKFEELLLVSSQRIPAFLAGPSGSGKTHAASQLAKGLALPLEAVSVGPMTSKSDLIGFIDANGTYHETGLIRCFKNGGVFLIDEIDAGNAGVLTILNMLLSNGSMATPTGMIEKHSDFICVAGANTYGTGPDRQYVGRCQLDEATLKRFFVIDWSYDEILEREISGANTDSERALISRIQAMRKNADNAGLRVTISPRDSIYAVILQRAGMPEKDILQGLVFKGLDKTAITKIKGDS
jgi:cobaltochelatase CobS